MKNQKGITLVALVITIIVLLILTGVTLSLVAGENGILGRAQGAATTQEEATIKQEIQLSVADAQVAYYEKISKNEATTKVGEYTTLSYYTNNCVSAKSVSNVSESGGVVTVTYITKSNVTYTVTFSVDTPNDITLTKVS